MLTEAQKLQTSLPSRESLGANTQFNVVPNAFARKQSISRERERLRELCRQSVRIKLTATEEVVCATVPALIARARDDYTSPSVFSPTRERERESATHCSTDWRLADILFLRPPTEKSAVVNRQRGVLSLSLIN